MRTARAALCALLLLILAAPAIAQEAPPHQEAAQQEAMQEAPRNVILFIADGGGAASYTMARDFLRWQNGGPSADTTSLAIDSLQTGSIRTFAADNRVTDSAASATAFSAGVKTYNGAIAVDTAQRPVATLLEAAERRGMARGLVGSCRLTHATPAAFSAHVPQRGQEAEIAAQQITHGIEVLLGGGWGFYLPESEDGWREDDRHVIDEAAEEGYQILRSRADLDAAQSAPVLGLFAESHMAYEIDRDTSAQPSLAAMTRAALDLLTRTEDARQNGFFLMVEGSRIDHAAHGNDAAAHLHDVLAYDEALAAALDFARRDGSTLIVATSDHETGGMTLGRGGTYGWHPEVLAEVNASQGVIAERIQQTGEPERVLREAAGITDLNDAETAGLDTLSAMEYPGNALAEIISRRARVGWTTSGHTAVDVNLYAYGPGKARFVGNFDNTHVGDALAELMGFDLEALTEQLRREEPPVEAAGERR